MTREITDVVIVHGKPPKARYEDPAQPMPHEANWLPGVARTAKDRGMRARVPALPRPYDPVYRACMGVVLEEPIDERTLVIAHSMGADLMLRWMSEHEERRLGGLILVAPWLNPLRKYEGLPPYNIDRGLVERCVGGLIVFYSSLDDEQAQTSLEMLREAFPDGTPQVRYVDIPHYGHLCSAIR